MRGGYRAIERGTLATLLVLICLLCGWPLIALLRLGALPDVEAVSPLQAILDTLSGRSVQRALWHSLHSASLAALIATLLGSVLALTMTLARVRARAVLVFLLLLPMMIPPHVTAIAWTQALGPSSSLLGWLGLAPPPGSPNPVQTPAGLVALLALQHLPVALLLVQTTLRGLPADLIDAARMAGAGQALLLRRILLPLLLPALIAATTLSFIAALGNFGINALIGIPARYTTLPVLIWQRLSSFGPGVLGEIATLAAILALLALVMVLLSWWLLARARRSVPASGGTLGDRVRSEGGASTAAERVLWSFVLATLGFPLLSLLAGSLVPTYGVALDASTVTLRHYVEVFGQSVTLRAFGNSAFAAGLAAALIALVSIPLAHYINSGDARVRRLASFAAVQADLAYAVPGLVMSVAFILVFLEPLPLVQVSLYGTLTLIILAYLAVFLAVGLKPVASAAGQLDTTLDEAARLNGAGFLRRMARVHAPLLLPAALSGAVLVFLTAYNEITVSALLWSSGNETIGSVIFNYEDGGYTTLAAAMAVLTVLASVALMLALSRFARRLPAGVVPWS